MQSRCDGGKKHDHSFNLQPRYQNDQQGHGRGVTLFFHENISHDERLHFTAAFKTLKPKSQHAVSRALKKYFITPGSDSTFQPLATDNSVSLGLQSIPGFRGFGDVNKKYNAAMWSVS